MYLVAGILRAFMKMFMDFLAMREHGVLKLDATSKESRIFKVFDFYRPGYVFGEVIFKLRCQFNYV